MILKHEEYLLLVFQSYKILKWYSLAIENAAGMELSGKVDESSVPSGNAGEDSNITPRSRSGMLEFFFLSHDRKCSWSETTEALRMTLKISGVGQNRSKFLFF